MLTFATKKLSTGANGQKAEAEFPFCPRSFDRAVMDFQDLRILFSPGSTQDQLYFNRDQLKKGPFGLFKNLFVVSLCSSLYASPSAPSWVGMGPERLTVTRTEI